MALSIIEMVFPVILAFLLGYLCKRKQIISAQGLEGIRSLVSKVLLPVVLFNAFFTAEYSGRLLLTFGVIYGSCALGLGAGFLLRKFAVKDSRYFPFLVTNFEGGMMGYALFGLLYPGQTHIFAMADIGQTLAAYTFYLVAMQAVRTGKASPKALAKNALTDPAFIGTVLGVLLGATGIAKVILGSSVAGVVTKTISFLAAPVSCLILIIVGYDLAFRRELMKPTLITIAVRLLLTAALLMLDSLIVFRVLPFDKQLLVAIMLAWSLPAPYIIPLYADMKREGAYISSVLSMETVISVLLFIGVAVYALG